MSIFKQNKPEKISPESVNQEAGARPDSDNFFPPAPEQGKESIIEQSAGLAQPEVPGAEADQPGLSPQPVADHGVSIHPVPKSLTLRQIESILEDDLSDIYFHLDTAHQRLFKEEGERASRQIEAVLATGKSIAIKVLAIIKKWLQTIPGVNKFFIEQEAKIKTDQIARINAGFPK